MALGVSQMIVKVLGDTTHVKQELYALNGQIASFAAGVNQQAALTNNVFTSMGGAMRSVGTVATQVGAGLTRTLTIPLVGIGVVAAKTGIDFEKAFAGVRKTIDENTNAANGAITTYDALKQSIINIATETGISQNSVAGIMQMAGQLGIRGNEAISAFTNEVAKLGITTGVSTDQLSMMLGKFTAIMGTDVETQIAGVSSVITALGNTTATTEDAILKFGVRLAAAGRLAGVSEQEILAISAAAESTGTKAERGGTALTKIFMRMQSEAYGAAEATDNFKNSITENDNEIARWTKTLEDAKAAQSSLGANATSAQMQELSDTIATATEQITVYTEANDALKDVMSATGTETTGFANLLGMTSAEFKELFNSTGGATQIFELFINKIRDAGMAQEDVTAIMKDLGLTDTRLVQAVLSLAQANGTLNESTGEFEYSTRSLTGALQTAENAMTGMSATDSEVSKFIDTVSGQFNRFKELLKGIAVVLTDDTTGALKDFLKAVNDTLEIVLTKLNEMEPDQLNNIVKAFLGLLALGPGLSLFGGFLKTFGTAFNLLGIMLGPTYGILGQATGALTGLTATGGALTAATTALSGGAMGPLMADGTFLSQPGLGPAAGNAVANRNNRNSLGQWINKTSIPRMFGFDVKAVGTAGAEAGDVFQGNFVQRAFGNANTKYKSSIDNFVANTNKTITNAFGKPGAASPLSAIVATNRDAGAFAADPAGAALGKGALQYSQSSAALAAPDFVAKETGLTNFLSTITKFSGFLLTSLPQIGLLLGSLSVVLAVVAAGFAMFFMATGKDAGDVTKIFEGLSEKVAGFGTFLQGALDNLIAKFPEFSKKFGEIFLATVNGIGDLLAQVITTFFDLLPEMLTLGGMFIVSLIDGFIASLPTLLDNVIKIIMALARGFLDALPTIIKVGFDILSSLISGFMKALPILLVAAISLVAQLGALIIEKIADGTLIEAGANIISGLIKGIMSMVGGLFEAISIFLKEMLRMILSFFGIKSPSKVMAEVGAWIIEGLINGIKAYFEILKLLWITIPKYLLDAFIGAVKWLYNIGKDILIGLWDGIKWYFENVFRLYFNVGKWIMDAFIGAGSWLFDAGKNVMQGLKNGIFNVAGGITSWFSDIGSKIVNGVTTFFKIKSPSRVMMGLGNMIGEGLAIGLEDSTSNITKAAQEMQAAAMIDPSALNSAMTVDGKMTHDYSGLTEAFVGALNAVGLNVYMDGKDVTDIVASHLTLAQRRGR